MQRPKLHHYVPRNHLRRFTSPACKVYVYDKTTGKQFETAVENVAAEQGFHVLPTFEDEMAKVDGKFKTIVDGLLENFEQGIFRDTDRDAIAPFIQIQLVRTAETREMVNQLAIDMAYRVAERAGKPIKTPRERLTLRKDIADLQHLSVLFDRETGMQFARSLCEDYIWLAGFNNADTPLWTADHPVVTRSLAEPSDDLRTKMLLSAGKRLFALSPKYMLILLHREFAASLEDRQGAIMPLTQKQVDEHNMLLLRQSTKHVYSPTDDFAMADGFRQLYPAACNPKRRRFRIS
jgi:hypothetical protein